MPRSRRHLLLRAVALAAVAVAVAHPPARAEPPRTRHVRGVIDSVTPETLTIATPAGDRLAVAISPQTLVAVVSPSTAAAIKPGAYIGTAAVPAAGGRLRALEVHIFSEAMRGVGEGHRPWEGGNTSMTNATVGEVTGGEVTGAEVTGAEVTGADGHTLRLTYEGGEQTVTVGPDTPVVAMDRGTRDLLVKGAHVSVGATVGEGGALQARFVAVGRDGFEPPL